MHLPTSDVRHAFPTVNIAIVLSMPSAIVPKTPSVQSGALRNSRSAVLIRGLPYPDPDRLAMVQTRNPQKGPEQERVTLADFADWRARTRSFEEIGYSFLWPGSRSTIVRTSSSAAVPSALVSSGWLRALGVRPVRGRLLGGATIGRGAAIAAIISDRF